MSCKTSNCLTASASRPARRAARGARARGPRRGATLVVVALLIVVGVLMGALVIETARLHGISQRLGTTADAAALSAIIELRNGGSPEAIRGSASTLLSGNPIVGGQAASLGRGASAVVPGAWDFATNRFTPTDWTNVRALRVTASYPAPWLLGRVFGGTSSTLTHTAIVAMGSIRTTRCAKPLAVPYSHLKASLGYAATDTTALTAADVARLIANRRLLQLPFLKANSNGEQGWLEGTLVPGNAYAVKLGPVLDYQGRPGNPQDVSGADFIAQMTAACGTIPPVSVGDWLEIYEDKTLKRNDLQRAVNDLCGGPGNAGVSQSRSCGLSLVVPVWDLGPTVVLGGAGPALRVRYLAVFQMTGYSPNTGIQGYFTTLTGAPAGGSSGLVAAPGPIGVPMLVQ